MPIQRKLGELSGRLSGKEETKVERSEQLENSMRIIGKNRGSISIFFRRPEDFPNCWRAFLRF